MNVEDFLRTHPRKPANADVIAACVKACFGCLESCTLCADACLGEGRVEEMRRCIRLDLDCAAVCLATGQVAARQTETDRDLLRAQLQACATACRICAEECQRHAGKHEHCRLCAESCRLCERACNDLIAAL